MHASHRDGDEYAVCGERVGAIFFDSCLGNKYAGHRLITGFKNHSNSILYKYE